MNWLVGYSYIMYFTSVRKMVSTLKSNRKTMKVMDRRFRFLIVSWEACWKRDFMNKIWKFVSITYLGFKGSDRLQWVRCIHFPSSHLGMWHYSLDSFSFEICHKHQYYFYSAIHLVNFHELCMCVMGILFSVHYFLLLCCLWPYMIIRF